jgi:Ser/Thr protein kinase RdoA (MazF antagonist)
MYMGNEVLLRICESYGLEFKSLLGTEKGYRNRSYIMRVEGNDTVNFILYKQEADILQTIEAANQVSTFAAEHGFPARRPLDPRIVELKGNLQTRYGSMYNYLPGHTLAWEAYQMEHLKVLGGALSDLHGILAKYKGGLPSTAENLLALNSRMQTYFSNNGVQSAMAKKLHIIRINNVFDDILKAASKFPHQQALHMDFVRGNILFEGEQLTGVLDFEKTSRGHPVLDVARTLAFLLVDCKYKQEAKITKYFLRSGYNKRGSTKLQHILFKGEDVLQTLVNFFLLHDFYKFLRHNPYESLLLNEHYARTTALLQKRSIIG